MQNYEIFLAHIKKSSYFCAQNQKIMMTKDEKVAYWLDLADYDLETAEAMYKTKRWLYVGFMCHQVVEKTLKAYWCKTQTDDPPYIHHLAQLAIRSNLYEHMTPEQQQLVARLMPMNIEARYPEYKARLAKRMTKEFCRQIIDDTKGLQTWIKSKL